MRKTPTKVVEKGNDNNLLSSVKKAATILVAALGLAFATSQDVNAQDLDFSNITSSEEIDKRKAEGKILDNENAKKMNTIAEIDKETQETKDNVANQEKIIAGLRADLGKDSKNPLKSNRSSFAYNSTKPKDNSKIGRDPNN